MKARLLPRVVVLQIFICCFAFVALHADTPPTNSPPAQAEDFKQPKTLSELLALPPDELEKVDIARIDLLCAEGLPGAENLDVEKSLQTLDAWTQYVKSETERNYYRFVEHPEKFKNSSGRYRMAVMAAVLSQDLRVQYNPKREKELRDHNSFSQDKPYGSVERSFFSDSSDLFLHGLLSDKRYGTCASMPHLYVAIGRRLGYPVSIAMTHLHGYVYYDEGDGKHFNIEATENRGFVTPSDDEYRHPAWGAPSSPEYFKERGLLKSMGNKEATAHILAERAAVFRSAGRHDEEAKTWATAARYYPDTSLWKQVTDGMQQAARMDEYQKWRDGVWKELATYPIPHGPGFAYFQDKRIKLRLFMDENLDRKAIEAAAGAYKSELTEYSKTAMQPMDGAPVVLGSNQPPPLNFFYLPPGGEKIHVRADLLPPFAHGELPEELKHRIGALNPRDPDTLLEIMWDYYGQVQATELARQKGEIERVASNRPILISEESIPPEFRRGVPPDLAMALSGMHDAEDIAIALWQYQQQRQTTQQIEMLTGSADPVSAALRQAGVPDGVARLAGLAGYRPARRKRSLTCYSRYGGIGFHWEHSRNAGAGSARHDSRWKRTFPGGNRCLERERQTGERTNDRIRRATTEALKHNKAGIHVALSSRSGIHRRHESRRGESVAFWRRAKYGNFAAVNPAHLR